MNTLKVITIILLSAASLAACTSSTTSPDQSNTPQNESHMSQTMADEAGSTDKTNESVTFTIEDVSAHNTPDDCWIVIDNQVYDVSGFGSTHAGGEAVYEGCVV